VTSPDAVGNSPAARRIATSSEKSKSSAPQLGNLLVNNSLSLTAAALFLVFLAGQAWTGYAVYNEEQAEHGRAAIAFASYLVGGHFLEATFENWESEFLQMGMYVLLTVKLFQVGSSESKERGKPHETDEDPRAHQHDPDAPWPVRKGGLVLRLYEHSLSIALLGLFIASFALHAVFGLRLFNEERAEHGQGAVELSGYLTSSQFWFESFQNWQSEFLAVLAIVVLTIFLRQRGSPQSKPVAESHAATED
jgi:hypothetical protein